MSYVAVHESSAFRQVFMYDTQNIAAVSYTHLDVYKRQHASYATIGNAVGLSRNTVRKYVQELERRGLNLTERTTNVTRDGRTQNGRLVYTILPIQLVVEQFYQEQFNAADIAREQQRIDKLMVQRNAVYRCV